MLALWLLSNWKLLFNSISWSLGFLFSWWLRCESRFFHARGLRDCVLRVRTPPALCEQLTNIVQRGWNHQTSGGFRTLTHVQCIYIIIQAKMWEVDLQNSGVLCISSSPFHVLALELIQAQGDWCRLASGASLGHLRQLLQRRFGTADSKRGGGRSLCLRLGSATGAGTRRDWEVPEVPCEIFHLWLVSFG